MHHIIDALKYVYSKLIAHLLYLRDELAIIVRLVIDVIRVHFSKDLLEDLKDSPYRVSSFVQVLTDFLNQTFIEFCLLVLCGGRLHRLRAYSQRSIAVLPR